MLSVAPEGAGAAGSAPAWLWPGVALVVLLTLGAGSYGIATWPMADDEVPSLVEMGLFHVDAAAFSVPAGQIGRLARANVVWYRSQRWLLDRLPHNQVGYRLPSLLYAALTAGLAFVLAAYWRGMWFAAALAIVTIGSPMFVFVSQINRFYSLPLLLLALTFACYCIPRGGAFPPLLVALVAALTVLSHNITAAVFVLGSLAAGVAYVCGRVSGRFLVRSGTAAIVSVLLYALYLRPIIHGWASTGNPTPVLISFAAHTGVPLLALASLGGWLALARQGDGRGMLFWWTVLAAGSLCFFQVAPVSWNPRYFVFFMPAFWVLAAHAIDAVARGLGRRSAGAVWYGCAIILLLPGLLSHYQDGSRHDYRAAAAVLQQRAAAGQPILSDDAETISYYLPDTLRESLEVRTKVTTLPEEEFFLVARSNAWAAQPMVPGRQVELLAEISTRRFDQFSHILRVYRVAEAALKVR
jgi:hypothetical protein